jgi:hypothetical protein
MMGGQKRGAIDAILGPDPREAKGSEEEGGEDKELHTIFSELLDAVHSKDVAAGVDALKAFFTSCDAEPHEEGPHTEEG